MYCTNCGAKNPDEANFCGTCGTPMSRPSDATTGALHLTPVEVEAAAASAEDLPIPTEELAEAVGELDVGTALLVVLRGPNEGARFLLDRDVVSVGRHPDSAIFLDDITVSRRHAEFRRQEGTYWVHDAGSLNGTYVNGTRAEDRRLALGDEVQIGKFKLVAFLAEPST